MKKGLKKQVYKEMTIHIYQSIAFLKSLEKPSEEEVKNKTVYFDFLEGPKKRCLVFDLDETLVHCVRTPGQQADVYLDIKMPSGKVA